MSDYAFLVDTTKCQGCRACQVACKQWNSLPAQKTNFFEGTEYTNPKDLSAITWNHVIFFPVDRGIPDRPEWTIMHKKCYHCIDANCVKVCPEKAIRKAEGWTVIDHARCIGCGACVDACVYQVPHLSTIRHYDDRRDQIIEINKSYKCNACTVRKRDVPACVKTCPSGALSIGNRHRIIKAAKNRVKAIRDDYPDASIYGLEQFGGLRVLTILRKKPETYGLPVNVRPVDAAHYESTRSTYELLSLFTLGLKPLKKAAHTMAKMLHS